MIDLPIYQRDNEMILCNLNIVGGVFMLSISEL